MGTETATVLLLDTTDTVAADINDAYRELEAIEIQSESTLESARERLSRSTVNSVVVHLDPLDDADRRAFVSAVGTAAPDCSLILLTADSCWRADDR